jgi:hypothetical protein
MKVDTRPFPGVNMVEGHMDAGEWSARRRLDFTFDVNMAGPPRRRDENEGAVPAISPGKAKGVHHRRTREACAVSMASLRASTQEI